MVNDGGGCGDGEVYTGRRSVISSLPLASLGVATLGSQVGLGLIRAAENRYIYFFIIKACYSCLLAVITSIIFMAAYDVEDEYEFMLSGTGDEYEVIYVLVELQSPMLIRDTALPSSLVEKKTKI